MFLLAFDIEFADEAWERACFAAIGSTITAPCFQGLACTRRGKRFLLQCWFKHALVEQLQDLRSQLLHYVHHQMTCPVRIVERVFP
ncbi:hypothetical protein PTSG_02639 [Salpingoeca rosetta]|uniref:Uncharacterized protein n=1 Tax=Salpingoeca rosetta (strain ATCC 50818 / BSB-021) TaxID=946362 RepID=F2U2W0_SALR5|nr:uncharacterized protein PTSG_02639 [Salpingoeca rosetta]EGD81954.1 hypothetical protein PTSG_02639 [Salpingoeca rosetta]|eukprot:XP_004996137.1 hypothetical protein PTSG_02639 [Salpingoeca rosetta]